jgi:hypothetical protein
VHTLIVSKNKHELKLAVRRLACTADFSPRLRPHVLLGHHPDKSPSALLNPEKVAKLRRSLRMTGCPAIMFFREAQRSMLTQYATMGTETARARPLASDPVKLAVYILERADFSSASGHHDWEHRASGYHWLSGRAQVDPTRIGVPSIHSLVTCDLRHLRVDAFSATLRSELSIFEMTSSAIPC